MSEVFRKVGAMHGKQEAEKGALSKVLSPVRWRKAFAEEMANTGRMRQQTKPWLTTTIVLAALATTLFVFAALP